MHRSIMWTYVLSSYSAHIIRYMLSCLVRRKVLLLISHFHVWTYDYNVTIGYEFWENLTIYL
jgi:hypothetical protein